MSGPPSPLLRKLFCGPWRGVLVLCLTQIIAWGAIYYPPVLTMPLIGFAIAGAG